ESTAPNSGRLFNFRTVVNLQFKSDDWQPRGRNPRAPRGDKVRQLKRSTGGLLRRDGRVFWTTSAARAEMTLHRALSTTIGGIIGSATRCSFPRHGEWSGPAQTH